MEEIKYKLFICCQKVNRYFSSRTKVVLFTLYLCDLINGCCFLFQGMRDVAKDKAEGRSSKDDEEREPLK